MTKDELLADIRRERAALDAIVGSLDEERLLAHELDQGWSVKDVLAHITSWEQLCLKWMREGRREEGPFTGDSLNALNARMYRAHRDQALDQVRAESDRSYETLVGTVYAVTSDLDALPPWASDEVTDGRTAATLGQTISANSNEHYREHIDQIQAWLSTPPDEKVRS